MLYNGGLLMTRVRDVDADRRRPGLPPDVAALVEQLASDRTVLRLVNLSPFQTSVVLVQAGAFGEHRFTEARYPVRTSAYPGPLEAYAAPAVQTETRILPLQETRVSVRLPPGMEITLDLGTARFVNRPSSTGGAS